MRKSIKWIVLVVFGAALALSVVSCASTPKKGEGGFLNGYVKNLQPGPEGGVKERWLKPGVDFSKYSKVMLDGVVFYFDKNSEDKGVDPTQMKEMADAFDKDLVEALKDKYPIVTEPGPDVVRIKIALTGIKQSRPVLSGVSTVLPIGLVVSSVKKGTTGGWTGSGATNMDFLAIDTSTNEVIAAARDEQKAGFTKRFSKYGSTEEAFKFWAQRLRIFMDEAHKSKAKGE